MFRLTRSHLLPIGVDFGTDAVRLLQLEIVGEAAVVRAMAQEPLPPEALAKPALRGELGAERLAAMLRRHGFAGKNVAASLPREIVHTKNFRLPHMPIHELETAAQFEARNLFSFDVEQAQIRCLPAGDVRQGNDLLQEVIVLAARNEDIDNYVELLHRSGVTPESLDFEPCALYRGIERFIRRREDEQEVHVLLDVGSSGTRVVIGRGREISFIKSVDLGGGHFADAVARRLEISRDEAQALRRRIAQAPETQGEGRDPVKQAVADATRGPIEQLAREVSLCLRYYSVTFRGHRPTRVRVMGGEAADPQVRSILSSTLSIPVEPARPLAGVDTARLSPAQRQSAGAEWCTALGLALKKTRHHFGSREGTPRGAVKTSIGADPAAWAVEPPASAEAGAATPAVRTIRGEAANA